MIKQSVPFLTVLFFIIQTSFAQNIPSQHPKLVVFILIDELSTDQLVAFRDQFSDRGINRLINGGSFYRNASYPAGSNYCGSNLSTFYTGAHAATHGIVSDWWYDYLKGKEVSAVYGDLSADDKDAVRYPTTERLLTSTVTDELKWTNNSTSRVTSIGFDYNYLVWTGGHRPDYLYSIDPHSGKVVIIPQGEKIQPMPEWALKFNKKNLPDTYSKRKWGPLKDLNRYHQMQFFSEQRTSASSFLYSLEKQEGKGAYMSVLHSPYGNKLIRDFAVAQIINDRYGKNDVTDVITLQFTSKSVHGTAYGAFDAETEDMLLRLDAEIADLLKTIDNEVGLKNTLIVTTSVSAPLRSFADNSNCGIPTGIFNGHKTSSLLNFFLMAKHGQGKWVTAYHDRQIYLNHKLIEERKMDIDEIKREASLFLTDVKGLAYAMPVSELNDLSFGTAALRSMKLNYQARRSGDIIVKIHPGWSEETKDGEILNRQWNATHLPLIFYGWKIKPQNIYQAVPMINVAPTISSFLDIPFPNGNEGSPLQGIIIQ